MVRVTFTENIQRHCECPAASVPGHTVREVLDEVADGSELYVMQALSGG